MSNDSWIKRVFENSYSRSEFSPYGFILEDFLWLNKLKKLSIL
jgi:hypothetical protein